MRAIEARGEADWTPFDWRVYTLGACLLSLDPVWSRALPEAPRELLERMALDRRSAADFEVRELFESVIGILLREDGQLAEAADRTLTALDCLTLKANSRCTFWIEVARDRETLGDYSACATALDNAAAELKVVRVTIPDPSAADLVEFDLSSARMTLEVQLGRPDRAAANLARVRELGPLLPDQESAQQWLRDEAHFALASDDSEGLIERLENLRAREGLAPAVLDCLGHAYLLVSKRGEQRLAPASEVFEEMLAHPDATALACAHARIGLAMVRREQGRLDEAAQLLRQARRNANTVLELDIVTEGAAVALERGASMDELAQAHAELLWGFEQLLERWDSIPALVDGAGFTNYARRRALILELLRLEVALDPTSGAQRALQRWLSVEARGSLARELGLEAPNEFELRQRLFGERAGALVYVPGPTRSGLFILDRERVEFVGLPASDIWSDSQRNLARLLAAPPRNRLDAERRDRDYREFTQELSRYLLVAPARARLDVWEELTIVGLDMLGYLPFECLESNGRELGLSKAVCYAPSLLLQDELERRWRESGAQLRSGMRLLAAPTDPADAAARFGWAAIDWDGRRAERLRELWDGRVRIDHGRSATWAALASDSGADLAVLEILAHGYYDGAQTPPAGIALAPSEGHAGYIASAQIAGLHAPPIVALAVCGAARGPLRSGDESTGNLGGAALRAGASVVLLSTLDIEQAASEALLDSAYESMVREGTSPARALRDARIALSASTDKRDPYYRNVLHCVGLGHAAFVRRDHAPGASRAFMLAATLVAGIALLAAYGRRRWRVTAARSGAS